MGSTWVGELHIHDRVAQKIVNAHEFEIDDVCFALEHRRHQDTRWARHGDTGKLRLFVRTEVAGRRALAALYPRNDPHLVDDYNLGTVHALP